MPGAVCHLAHGAAVHSILATVLAATLLASARPVSYQLSTAGAMLALVATWATPTSALATVDWGVKLALSTAFVGLPAFFASLCFVALFRQRPESANAFGWNLLGAVTGGLLELGAMATGFKALHLVALLAYMMAFAAWTRARRSSAARAFGSTATPWR
jgi:ABC-type dipeptide/oligopeptide/nickel transport system permease component